MIYLELVLTTTPTSGRLYTLMFCTVAKVKTSYLYSESVRYQTTCVMQRNLSSKKIEWCQNKRRTQISNIPQRDTNYHTGQQQLHFLRALSFFPQRFKDFLKYITQDRTMAEFKVLHSSLFVPNQKMKWVIFEGLGKHEAVGLTLSCHPSKYGAFSHLSRIFDQI